MPSKTVSKEKLGINIIELLIETNFIESKSEARRLIEQMGISLNQEKLTDANKCITANDLDKNFIVIQKGKKTFLKIIFE